MITPEKSPVSRKKVKKQHRGRTILLISLSVAAVLVAGGFIYAKNYIQNKLDLMETMAPEYTFETDDILVNDDIVDVQSKEKQEGFTTIMLYGVDARNNHDLTQDANADTDIILCINNTTKEIKLVSVLRDTFLETSTGKHKKLTDIYAAYSVKESLNTINKCFDLSITNYVSVNWKMVAKAVDLLGGIDLELSSSEVKYINKRMGEVIEVTGYSSDPLENVGKGTYHLNGVQAVTHSRNRSVGHHDLSRAARQQQVIKAMLTAARSCSITELNNMLDEIMPGISTNLSAGTILDMALDIMKYTIGDTTIFPFEYKDQSNLTTAYVYCDTLSQNVSELHAYLYGAVNYQPSNTVEAVSDYITEYRHDHP